MPGLTKKMFVMVFILLCFDGLLAMKCVSINNQPCLVRPWLIDLSLNELHYYQFIIMSRCDGSCNTVKDPFGVVCVSNKMEPDMIKGIN